MENRLTPLQVRVVKAYERLNNRLERCPTQLEVAEEVGISRTSVAMLLRRLADKGAITRRTRATSVEVSVKPWAKKSAVA